MHGAMRNRHAPFGDDAFGRAAERIARFFGTPGFLAAQSAVVAAWIAFNAVAVGLRWDPYRSFSSTSPSRRRPPTPLR
jgi:uncharacterized membrane protein